MFSKNIISSTLLALGGSLLLATTPLISTANAATNNNVNQETVNKISPRFAGYNNIESIQYHNGVVQVKNDYGTNYYCHDINGNFVKYVPNGSKWAYDSIYYTTSGESWYHIGNNTFITTNAVYILS